MGYGPWGHKESVTTEVTERACMKQKGLPQVVLVGSPYNGLLVINK